MRRHDLQRFLRRELPRILLAAHGTAAAIAALAVAELLQLKCPFWAAMTALIVIQPTRGLLLEKSFYRIVGTAIGSVAGLMMLFAGGSPAMLTILLSLWLSVCVGTGNLLYGFRSYGALVAGCTGAIIVMSGYNNSQHLQELVFGRIACIIIGILVSTAATLFFSQRCPKRALLDRLIKVSAADIELVALLVCGEKTKELVALRQNILLEIAEIEGTLDVVWAGSLDLKRKKRQVGSLIVSLLSLLEAGKLAGDHLARLDSSYDYWRESLARHLYEVARRLGEQGSTRPKLAGLEATLAEAGGHLPLLGETLAEMLDSLHLVVGVWDASAQNTERPAGKLIIRHRDWREAGRAALRAALAMATVGVAWHLTGWKEGPLMMMAASIMVSIFSTHDRPAVMLNHILMGASVGVAAALLGRLVLLSGNSDPVMQGVVSIPVLMFGIIALSHGRTARGAMDGMLFFLFVMQPGVPVVAAPPAFVAGGFAVLGGVGVAIVAFRFLLPIDPARRLRSLLIAIVRDLVLMAAADSLLVEKCRARTHHRVLRLLANARKLDEDVGIIVDGGGAALAIGRCMQWLREKEMKDGISLAASGAIRETTLKLSAAILRPEEILSALQAAAARLCAAMEPHLEAYNLLSAAHPLPVLQCREGVGEYKLVVKLLQASY